MAAIDLSNASSGGGSGGGNLQLSGGASMSSTLTLVTDTSSNASQLKLATNATQVVGTLQITTNNATYLDIEDGSGNNRFTISRDPSSQQVNVDFASNPTGSTTTVGAIRTYVDGVNLSEVMTFREDGNVGIGTLTPANSVEIERTTGNSTLNIQGNAGTFISVKRFSNNSTRGRLELYKSRGTIASPLVIQTGDEIGSVDFYGYDGSANQRVGILYANAESVVGSTITPQIAIGLGTSAVTNSYKMVVKNDGNVTIGNELTSLGARLGIKGSGSTSATTSLLVQNSSGAQMLNVQDDKKVYIGTTGYFVPDTQSTAWYNTYDKAIITSSEASNIVKVLISNNTHSFISNVGGGINGQIGVNTNTPNSSAALDIVSTTAGFLPPRMTNAQRSAISTPAEGLQIHNTTNNGVAYYDGTNWGYLSGAKQSVTINSATQTIYGGNGNCILLDMQSSTTLTFSNHVVGTYIFQITQGGVGSYTITWPASVKWSGGTAPTLTTTVGKTDIITLYHDGTTFFGTYSLNY